MKKILIAVACVLTLAGCGKRTSTETRTTNTTITHGAGTTCPNGKCPAPKADIKSVPPAAVPDAPK